MKKVLLFNATGCQGSTIADRLLKEGYEVISPVRSEEGIARLKKRGIEAFPSDFSTASLVSKIKEVERVVLQIPAAVIPNVMTAIASEAMEAIRQAGHPKTIFVISSTVPKRPVGIRSVDARFKMVQLAKGKIPNAPILSSTEYLENFSTTYREPILNHAIIPQTIPPTSKVNYLSWDDLARYVLAALESDQLLGRVYEIGGNEGLNGLELAERLGGVLEKKLTYVPVSHNELQQMLTPIMGPEVAKDYAEFYYWQDTDGADLLNPATQEIRDLLNIKLPTFEEWASKAFGLDQCYK